MQIERASSSTITDLWTQVQAEVQQAQSLEDAAQQLATALHTAFAESVVLARVYTTVPFATLPAGNQAFVRRLAESATAAAALQGTTPVLSLIGTHGQEAAWNNRRNSQGHVGIPLISLHLWGGFP